MAELPFMPLWTDAYLADTDHLSFEEHGVYLKLLMTIWRTPGCQIPNDQEWICRRLRVSKDLFETLVQPVLEEYLDNTGNHITSRRLQREYKIAQEKSLKQSVRAKSRWNKEKGVSRGNARGGTAAAYKKGAQEEGLKNSVPDKPLETNETDVCRGNASIPIPIDSKKDIAKAISKENKTPPKSKPKIKGSRLPDDWYPGDGAFAWSLDQIGAVETNGQIEHFKDHWKAESGARSVKRDWDAAFRNWIRNHLKFGNSRPGGAQAASISTSVSNILAGRNSGQGLQPDGIPNDRANTSQRPGNGSGDAGSVTDAIEQIRDHAGTDDAPGENSQPDSETKGSRAHAVRVC